MFKLIFTTTLILLINTSSYAYLGPGIAGGTILAILGIIVAFVAIIFGVAIIPAILMVNKK